MRNVFGWDLPPGCTHAMIDEQAGANLPQECEDCDLFDEELGTCPYEGFEDMCFKISLITECGNCKKKLNKVKAAFKPECVHTSLYDVVFCCCTGCKDDLDDKLEMEYKEDIPRYKQE